MLNLILSTTADKEYGGYASGIDTEKLFTFLFIVMFIISVCLCIYILHLHFKISKLEEKINQPNLTNTNENETSKLS